MNERHIWQARLRLATALASDPFGLIQHAAADTLTARLLARVNPDRRTDRSATELGGWDQRTGPAPSPWAGRCSLFAALSLRVIRDPSAYGTWADPAVRAALWPTAGPAVTPTGLDEISLTRWVVLGLPDHALSDGLIQAILRRRQGEDWSGFADTYRTLRQDDRLAPHLDTRWLNHAQKQPDATAVREVFCAMPEVWQDHAAFAAQFPDLVDEVRTRWRAAGLSALPAAPSGSSRRRS